MKDLTNQKFNMLTALYPLDERRKGKVTWHCRCDCGQETNVTSYDLTKGNTKSCGCLKRKGIDITNQRFGSLIALYPTTKRRQKSVVWHCRCDCGKEAEYACNTLLQGSALSCGCLRPVEDLTGRKFGEWTVLRRSERLYCGRHRHWICQCSCGTVKEVMGQLLRRGESQSCGCSRHKGKHRDFTGEKRGRLTALRPTGKMIRNSPEYVWQCECGNEVVLPVSAVRPNSDRKCPECEKVRKQKLGREMYQCRKEIAINGVAPASIRNIVNGRLPSNNTSGVRGVCKTKGGKWTAAGTENGKRVYLGTYATLKEAAEARERFVEQKYGEAIKKLNDS